MKTRPRDGGDNPNRPRLTIAGSVYEKFKPISEWKHEDDHDSLLLYLPGFRKEFIKVTIEGSSILRVRGERLLAGNKWNRFREDFKIPKTCKLSGIRAKFYGGVLTVTMPINTPAAAVTAATKPQKPPMKTAGQNNADSANLRPQFPMENDEEKPDRKVLDRAEEKEALIGDDIIKRKTEMELRKEDNGIIDKLKEYYKGVATTAVAVVAVVALGVYVYFDSGYLCFSIKISETK